MVNVKIVFFVIMVSKSVLKWSSIEEKCKLIKEVEAGLKKNNDKYGIAATYIKVSEQSIANCFIKAGFGLYSEWEEDDNSLVFFN